MTAPRPVRLRLCRFKGYSLQAHSLAVNGLPAVNVARPGRYGNPAKIGWSIRIDGDDGWTHLRGNWAELGFVYIRNAGIAVEMFRRLPQRLLPSPAELCGFNLACWCSPADPCHGDVWLQRANGPVCEAA